MSVTTALQGRLKELSATLGQIQPLVSRLRGFTTSIGQGDEARVELGAEIHARLKETEEELELLRVEVEGLETGSDTRKKASAAHGEKEVERERVVAMAGRLADDLKRTRGDFRNAQLQAKRNAELAKRKERELLLSRSQSSENQRKPSEKLTQDDLALNASNDVTAALRRTHQLMQTELSRSQFAQETLEQSTAAISSLSDSYSSLDTLLSSSRSLANSLLRSQKSDTWYLETAFYILIGTITWLLFRRILYGPMWWLVWLPVKLASRFVFAVLGAVGLSSTAVESQSHAAGSDLSMAIHQTATAASESVTASGTTWDEPSTESESDRVIDQIGKMAEDNGKQEGTNIDDITPEEKMRQDEIPRNPKKRIATRVTWRRVSAPPVIPELYLPTRRPSSNHPSEDTLKLPNLGPETPMASTFFNNKARAAAAAASSSSKPKAGENKEETTRLQPWVEKYRPKTLDDVAAQDHTTKVLQRTLQASNLPHMLFYGPPGTGKTSTILALAKSLFGPALYRSRILELNASDERGIGIVRDKVKNFARAQLSQATGLDAAYRAQYPCPSFKIIILDEADSMTQDAQSALRRTMEQYSRITRFCLVCNYVTRIIEPLASRCSKFRFKSLDNSAAGVRLEEIARAENLRLEDGVVDTLIRCGEGDLRRAITYLQSAARLAGVAGLPGKKDGDDDAEMTDAGAPEASSITVRTIEEIAGVVPESVLDQLVQAMQPTNAGSAYKAVSTVITDLVADGWSATQVIGQLYRRMVFNEAVPDLQKNKIVMLFSEMDKRLVDGADEHLSILDLTLRIAGILRGA
ncbi:Sec20 [Penicillium alfredii]|uniref:Replication factor C subunit 2 n=1 Tax=Penicillium alfredii TaxID=1506179 RepID=A0A9W9GA37_9EURO|nr:Sec20 [Penicillium alfredii]KAJ5114955.1 Sec20 [Penicillium alfredii]